ncbi:MAG TPA: extracellular solute-binding protein, partial [Aeromicrobium sp.]|nr:extracellular solute-binding protein [Aeromicrobium sp.]
TFGDEWSAENPFEVGKVAMAFDGEWRIPIIKSDGAKVNYAVAPLPVPDDQLASYGKGFLTGTIIGIAARSRSQQASWEFVKYLTTNEQALVSFGNQISNLPSTLSALKSPDLPQDPAFKTFLDISANPQSVGAPATANGNAYLTVLHRFAAKWESGEAKDLHQGLADADKQIDAAIAQTTK